MNILNFSDTDVSHTPVSSVKPEEIGRCKISGMCCSEDGVVYAVDQGSKKIYRVEIETGNCFSFGRNVLGKGSRQMKKTEIVVFFT